MGGFLPGHVWDPLLIVGQVLLLQAAFHLLLGLLLLPACLLLHLPASLALLLSHALCPPSHAALFLAPSSLLASLLTSLLVVRVVARAKLCLDHCLTLHVLHLVLLLVLVGLPSWQWLLLQAVALLLSTLLSEYLCMQAEMQDIQLSYSARDLRVV